MKKAILLICVFGILLVAGAQKNNEILFSVGKDSITATEFIGSFNKNNTFSKATEAELREYMDLYINFKLKVQDGLDTRIDTLPAFRRELEIYKSQAAQPYLEDKEATESLINEAIERSKWMVRASHILISCDPNASPQDTLTTYNKALDIRKKIVAGTITFPDAAVQFSSDPSARDEMGLSHRPQYGNKGDLGYFSVFDLIYPFETAAYNTPMGTVSMPIRTQFGYHLVWVQDKQQMVSKIDVSQILLLDTAARFGRMSPHVKEKITLIEEALQNGEDFSALAEQYTDDPASKANGGRVQPFSANRLPGDYIKQAISLEKEQISAPFPTVVGWHIIKLNELIVPDIKEEELRFTLISKIQKDSRSTKSKESLFHKLKKEYHFSEKGKKAAFSFLEKNLKTTAIMPPAKDMLAFQGISKLKPMATFANKTISIQEFINYLERFNGIELNMPITPFLETQFDLFVKDFLMKYEFSNLENKYPDYKTLLSEYHQGMILFEMNNNKVWNLALKDTTGLELFYETIKGDYLDEDGNYKPLELVHSIVLNKYQNKLETEWLLELRERYPVWVNEKLFQSILKK